MSLEKEKTNEKHDYEKRTQEENETLRKKVRYNHHEMKKMKLPKGTPIKVTQLAGKKVNLTFNNIDDFHKAVEMELCGPQVTKPNQIKQLDDEDVEPRKRTVTRRLPPTRPLK